MSKALKNVVVPIPSEDYVKTHIEELSGKLTKSAGQFMDLAMEISQEGIRDEIQESKGIDLSAKIMDVEKQLENIRVSEVKPYQARTKVINNALNPTIKKLSAVRKTLNSAVKQYHAFKLAQQKRQEEIIRKKALETQKELEAMTPEGMEAPKVQPIKAAPIDTTVTTKSGAKGHMTKRLVIEIVNPDAVPRKFCDPVRSKIDAAIRGGVKNISGVKFEWVEDLVVKRG